MDEVLDGVYVLDARIGDVALVAEDEARADHELVLLVAKTERQIARDREEHRGNEQRQQPHFPAVRYAPEVAAAPARGSRHAEEDQQTWQREPLDVARQIEQERGGVQALFRRHRWLQMEADARG